MRYIWEESGKVGGDLERGGLKERLATALANGANGANGANEANEVNGANGANGVNEANEANGANGAKSEKLKESEASHIIDKLGLSEIILNILLNRGFNSETLIKDFIECKKPSYEETNPYILKDLKKAAIRLEKGLKNFEKIIVYGDYDADGITGSSLLYMFFQVYSYFTKRAVVSKVILPERFEDGYGLKIKGVREAKEFGADILITIDNGTSACKEIAYATELGIDVIVIDHHRVEDELPKAYAIINPKQKDCEYKDKGLSAVGLVYKLTEALGKMVLEERESRYFQERYIDLVAVGTYQDMAPLRGENRYFVSEGLKVLGKLCNGAINSNMHGFKEIINIGRGLSKITEDTIGYVIGPMLNAAGRIGSPSLAFELLTTKDKEETKRLSQELYNLNNKRKQLTEQYFEEAILEIEKNKLQDDKIILLISKSWNQGIIGLIAQRVVNKYKRNCIVMSNRESDIYTGSARAYGGFNMGDIISKHSEYFLYSGGHSKAAGFSLEERHAGRFIESLLSLQDSLEEEEVKLKIDSKIKLKDICLELVKQQDKLRPFGVGNLVPIYMLENVKIVSIKESRRGLDTLLCVSDMDGKEQAFVAFGQTSYIEKLKGKEMIDIAFRLSSRNENITCEIVDVRESLIV